MTAPTIVAHNRDSGVKDAVGDVGLEGVRWLVAGDEDAFIDLLRSCYRQTYSYRALYCRAGVRQLIGDERFAGLGYFDSVGALQGHTGFWVKDGALESGLSLVRPLARGGFSLDAQALWSTLRARLGRRFELISQNTTTRHQRGQLYAMRYLRAVPTGFIFNYALGERLVAIDDVARPMHALSMASALRGWPAMPLAVPAGVWAPWLRRIAAQLGARCAEVTSQAAAPAPHLEEIDWNPSVGLRRRRVSERPTPPSEDRDGERTDLVHIPMEAAAVAGSFEILLGVGYLPVGLAPRASAPTEIVLQRIEPRVALDHCAEMDASSRAPSRGALAGTALSPASLISMWRDACQQHRSPTAC